MVKSLDFTLILMGRPFVSLAHCYIPRAMDRTWHIDSRVVCLFFPNPPVDLSISDQNYNRILWGTWTANQKFLWWLPRQSVVKIPPFHCRGVSLIPGWGTQHTFGIAPPKNFFIWMCKGLRTVKTLLKNQDIKPLLHFKVIIRQCDQLRISKTD